MLYGDSGKENGSYCGIFWLLIGIMEKSMETWTSMVYWGYSCIGIMEESIKNYYGILGI